MPAITASHSLDLQFGGTQLIETFTFAGSGSPVKLLIFSVLYEIAVDPTTTIAAIEFDVGGGSVLSLTRKNFVTPIGAVVPLRLEVWYAFTTGDLQVDYPSGTMTITMTGGDPTILGMTWATFVGSILASNPLGTSATGSVASDTTVSAAVTSATNGLVVAAMAGENGAPVIPGDQTVSDALSPAVGTNQGITQKAGAASVTMSGTSVAADALGIIAVPIQYGGSFKRSSCSVAGLRVGTRGQPLKPLRKRHAA